MSGKGEYNLENLEAVLTGDFVVGDEHRAILTAKDAEIERLRVALRPFAEAGGELDEDDPERGEIWEHSAAMAIDFRDLRAAVRAYAPTTAPETRQDRRSVGSGQGEPPDTPTGDTRG